MRSLWLAAALALTLAPTLCAAQIQTEEADVALVLAVDVSGSVDEGRFKLQREGIAVALESDDFAVVLSGGINQAIEIAVVEWAEEQTVVVPWTVVRGHEDLLTVARLLRHAGRAWLHTKTDLNGGIVAASELFASKPLPSIRQVIDVSGDGRQNSGEMAAAVARDDAVGHGIIINGLPIVSGAEPDVDNWYRDNVIGGPGAFLIVANGYDDFANAFRQKLAFEVAGLAPGAPSMGGKAGLKGPPRRLAYADYFTAKTQTEPPCGTLLLTPTLSLVSPSWMRCASTPQPDCTAMYCVPSTS
jgi:uncharacterized protein DUF1194